MGIGPDKLLLTSTKAVILLNDAISVGIVEMRGTSTSMTDSNCLNCDIPFGIDHGVEALNT